MLGQVGFLACERVTSWSTDCAARLSETNSYVHVPAGTNPGMISIFDGSIPKNADVAWNVDHFMQNCRVSKVAISGLSNVPNFRLLGQVQKFHCSLVDQRKGCLKGRLAPRREILWWML